MNAREQIAGILDKDRLWPDAAETADAIISAMPDILAGMIKDLEWEGFVATLADGTYYTVTESFSGKTWRVDFVGRSNSVVVCRANSEQAAKAAANKHHRKQILAAFNLTVDT